MTLKQLLERDQPTEAVGIYDLISARIAEEARAEALYMTGYGVVASHLGLPDLGLATYSDMLSRVNAICEQVHKPVIADADTGYGGIINVYRTVKGYEKAGVAAIQLEDQVFPKKCGHTPNREVVHVSVMESKIKAACDARESDDMLIIARTDALTKYGYNAAIERGQAFEEAGADVIFIESPESHEQVASIPSSLTKPALLNLVHGGKTPFPTRQQLQEYGYKLIIYPTIGFLSAAQALREAYVSVLNDPAAPETNLYEFLEFHKLLNFKKYDDIAEKHEQKV